MTSKVTTPSTTTTTAGKGATFPNGQRDCLTQSAATAAGKEEHHHSGTVLGLVVGSLGIYVCYAAYGLAQERM